jgi:hypothetical protein
MVRRYYWPSMSTQVNVRFSQPVAKLTSQISKLRHLYPSRSPVNLHQTFGGCTSCCCCRSCQAEPHKSSGDHVRPSLSATLASPSSYVRPSSMPATAPAYAAMPATSPMLPISAVASPVSSTASSSLLTTSTKRSGSSSSGGFDDLWTMSLGSAGASKSVSGAGGARSMKGLKKERVHARI